MFILKKIFQLRDKAQNNQSEKPFLEHLEDLRVVITKIVLTLLISTLACFIFKNQLMSIIRRPIEQVWTIKQTSKMPDGPVIIDLEIWELAKKAADDTAFFPEAQREYYYDFVDPNNEKNLRFHAGYIKYYRAALDLENEQKDSGVEFISKLPDISEDVRAQLVALMDKEKRPDAALDAQGKVVRMQSLTPSEGFMLSFKLAFFAGIVIAFPFLVTFILQFILPGLKDKERRALWPAMAIGFGLFLFGVFFSYFLVLPKVLDFFYNYSQEMGVMNEWRIGYYISFVTQFTLIFGLSFELPVIVMTMVKIGLLTYEMMRNTRAYAVLAIVIIAAIITPTPDAFTLLLLAGPMIVLYEICIWLAYFDNKKRAKQDLDEEEADLRRRLASPVAAPMTQNRDQYDEYKPQYDPSGESDSYDEDEDGYEDDNDSFCDDRDTSDEEDDDAFQTLHGEAKIEEFDADAYEEELLETERIHDEDLNDSDDQDDLDDYGGCEEYRKSQMELKKWQKEQALLQAKILKAPDDNADDDEHDEGEEFDDGTYDFDPDELEEEFDPANDDGLHTESQAKTDALPEGSNYEANDEDDENQQNSEKPQS
ncbi:MAG: twin-arginine translocase subunit TatC [Akkermansiaceae bacterium]